MIGLAKYWGKWGIDDKTSASILEREVNGSLKGAVYVEEEPSRIRLFCHNIDIEVKLITMLVYESRNLV